MHRCLVAFFVLAFVAAPARATQQGVVVTKKWKTMDLCTKLAQTAFPDFTAEAAAKREARLRECLGGNNLPPRDPYGPGQ